MQKAFTLIELLFSISLMVILSLIIIVVYNSVFNKASMAAEVSAGKTLIFAYHAATADNNGIYLPARDYTAQDVKDADGKPIRMREMKARYPFRLAPYFGYKMDGTVLVNKNKSQIQKIFGSGLMFNYGISVFPAMGINNTFFGGYKLSSGKYMHQNECITSIANADRSIVAFVSAGVDDVDGYEYVKPPYYWGGSENADPSENGFVDFRFNKKAVVVFSEGSIKSMTMKDLKDMRLWSRNAAIQNNPDYVP